MPDFTFVDFEGKSHKLSDFRGKCVLLDFWGTWCGPCVAQIPHLKETYEKYHDRGFEILGMGREVDDKQTAEKVKKFLGDKGVTRMQATSESIRELVDISDNLFDRPSRTHRISGRRAGWSGPDGNTR